MTKTEVKPPCCPRDSLPPASVLHAQDPQGTVTEISPPEGLVGMLPMPCYCTGVPLKKATRIVVVFTDVYGMDSGHHKVFADTLAERLSEDAKEQVAVVIPDLFRGTPILQPWMSNDNMTKDIMGSLMGAPGMVYRLKTSYPPDKVEADIFHLLLPFLTEQTSANAFTVKLSCVGFCFGGWVVGRVLGYTQRQPMVFQCGVGIHPSWQPNLVHLETQSTMAERIHRPILLLPAWNDVDLKPNTALVNIVASKLQTKKKTAQTQSNFNVAESVQDDDDKSECPTVSIEFPTMMHGWVTRGDPTDPNVAAEQERALQLAVDFIQKHSV